MWCLEENGVNSRSFLRELRRRSRRSLERAVASADVSEVERAEGAGCKRSEKRGNSVDVSRRSSTITTV